MAAAGVVRHLSVLLLCFYWVIPKIQGINLDPRFSVIKRGGIGSYFGYSVAQHQILAPRSTSANPIVQENVLFIGAPKEKNNVGGKETGGSLYRCDAEDESPGCTRITDGVTETPRSSELIDDQWLGVSVASQGPGKKVVACAHRYVRDNAALGICYSYLQTLDYDSPFIPCKRLSHTQYLQDFGLCQAGMSVAIGQDDALVMGAPGSVFWKGVIFLTNVTDELGVSWSEIPSPFIDAKKITPPAQPTPTKPYSYNGYAIAMGRFDKTRTLYFVSGAPKSHNKGEIVFFRNLPQASHLRYETNQIIRGPLDFSGFGSSLLALDINKDGYDDLIVGAPYYFKKNHGGAIYVYLGGSTMISEKSVPVEVLSRKMGIKECEELLCEHARFGMSLSRLGDINMDSYEDFAVGAPYEGKGAVYIYHGDSSETGFNLNYAQRITASDLPVKDLMSFGQSLSGGMDLDRNGYPDLLVGAYESDAVALIRSRPIIKINPQLTVSPLAVELEATPLCSKYPSMNRHCVDILICLNFTTKPADSIKITPRVVYRLEAEKNRRIARVDLMGAVDPSKKVLENKILTLRQDGTACDTETALIKSSFDDKLNPIEFTFSFGLETDGANPMSYPRSAVQDINLFPVLDTEGSAPGQANSVSVEVDFVKECGDDNKCISNLQFQAVLKDLTKDSSGNYELVIKQESVLHIVMNVNNMGEPAYLTRIYVQKPKSVSFLGIETEDSVTCQGLKGDETMIICDQIGNPLRAGKTIDFIMSLNVPREMAEIPELYNITAFVNTSSTEENLVNNKHVMKFRVINKAEIFLVTNVIPDNTILCQGEPRGASAIKNEVGIGASVKHNFIVRNSGPGVVSESYITIYWPYEVADPKGDSGKYLLYLMRKPKITGPVIKCNDDDIRQYVNPLKIKEVAAFEDPAVGASRDAPITVDGVESLAEVERRRRDAENREKRSTGSVVVMSCKDQSARCFEFKCKLGKLEPNTDFVKITMESRLWESTLLSDYRKASDVQIISWGELTLPTKLMITQDPSNDQRRAITRAVPDFKETSGQKVQWWIILIAVLIGIIVLLVVIFILYKLGFFRRKRQEDMQMYKAEKKQAMLIEYDDDGV